MFAISPEGLRAVLEAGAVAASTALASQGLPWKIRTGPLALCPLADFPEKAVCPDAEVVAAVMRSLTGGACGSVVLALEPKAALRLVQAGRVAAWREAGDGRDQIQAFVTAGAAVGEAMALVALHDVACGRPSLLEESLPGVLVATHAPRDVMVVSCELHFRREGEQLTGYLCLLLDAKGLPLLAEPL